MAFAHCTGELTVSVTSPTGDDAGPFQLGLGERLKRPFPLQKRYIVVEGCHGEVQSFSSGVPQVADCTGSGGCFHTHLGNTKETRVLLLKGNQKSGRRKGVHMPGWGWGEEFPVGSGRRHEDGNQGTLYTCRKL